MYLGLCILGGILVTWLVTTATTTRQRDESTPARRDLDRRAQLRACPDRATPGDVERLLRDHGVPSATAAHTLGLAAERRVSARTIWAWADRYGADRLVLAVDAGLAERRMRRHLEAGTTPDWDALEVFADLNATVTMPTQEVVDTDVVTALDELTVDLYDWTTGSDEPTVEPLDLAQFDHLPPILAPGLDAEQRRSRGSAADRGHRAA